MERWEEPLVDGRTAMDRCRNISPFYSDGTHQCELIQGHDSFHEGGDWTWCDGPAPERDWRAVLSMKGAQE